MIDQIVPSDFATWVSAQSRSVTLLDCREAWELQTAKVQVNGFDFKHIPMNDTPARMAELNVDTPIAVLCHHGMRSQRVAQFLMQNQFTNVVNVTGGIAAWSRTVDPSIPQY